MRRNAALSGNGLNSLNDTLCFGKGTMLVISFFFFPQTMFLQPWLNGVLLHKNV